jgi:hypothetical protein
MAWIKFLLLPLLALTIYQLLCAFILGGWLQLKHNGFWDLLATGFGYVILLSAAYELAPTAKKTLAALMGCVFFAFNTAQAILTDGQPYSFFGSETQYYQMSGWRVFAELVGLVLGIVGMIGAEEEQAQQPPARSGVDLEKSP